MIFDTHAHYDDKQFDADREELLGQMEAGGIGTIVNASATVRSWEKVLELTRKYPFIYGMIGVHPDEVGDLDEETFARMEDLLKEEKISNCAAGYSKECPTHSLNSQNPCCRTVGKIVAVGEIGLDYYWDKEQHDIQKQWFIRQLRLARRRNLPVNVHSREAAADTMKILKEYGEGMDVIVHCYFYSREMAEEYVKMGYLIGVGGVVTFKNAKKLKEAVQAVPLSHIVLETDCPYLAPEPYRGKRNSSLNLPYVAQAVAELKGVTAEEVIRVTEENAKAFYKI